MRMFIDEYRTPITGKSAAKGIRWALDKEFKLLHFGGKERLSRFDIAIIIAKSQKLSLENIEKAYQDDFKMAAARPKDVSLNSDLAKSMGYEPNKIKDDLNV